MLHQKRRIIITLILCIISAYNCSRNQEDSNQKQLFDLNWKFYQGNVLSAYQINVNDKNWINIDLPHDWIKDDKLKIIDPHLAEDGWYRKHFIVPEKWKNKHILLEFESLSYYSEIFINGNSIGTPSEKDNSFQKDISPFLNYRRNNVIVVQIKRSNIPDNEAQAVLGICGHVWLIVQDSNDLNN